MQTCSKCKQQTPDSENYCTNCGADLSDFSESAVLLQELKSNPRVTAIRVSVSKNACTTCRSMEGVYSKENVPAFPIDGCSNPSGCNCAYAPILEEIYP